MQIGENSRPGAGRREGGDTVLDSNTTATTATLLVPVLCSSLLLLALCLSAGIIYFLRCRPAKRPREDSADSASCGSEPQLNSSSHSLVPGPGLEPHHLPPRLPDSTPSYWSATRLLTEHEHRALAACYGQHEPGI